MVAALGSTSSIQAKLISTLSCSQRPLSFKSAHKVTLKTHSNQIRRSRAAGRYSIRPNSAIFTRHVVAAAISAPAVSSSSLSLLPEDLKNATAIVRAGDTEIYILGISHVSKVSVRHIQDLITAVNPDTVAVELCRDRTGLLIPENAPPPQRFHAPSVTITGYTPAREGWPTVQQLTSNLKSTNQSVSASEIEDDVITLLSTGLFSTVRPVTKPCEPNGAPAFMLDSQQGKNPPLILVAPLGRIDFIVTMRKLPPLQDFTFNFDAANNNSAKLVPSSDVLNKIKDEALENGRLEGLFALLTAKAALLKESKNTLSVTFSGVETGKIVVSVVENETSGSSDNASTTGLEGTAVDGAGFGIQSFSRKAPRDKSTASTETTTPTAAAGMMHSEVDNIKIEKWSESELAFGIENFSSLRSGLSGGLASSFASLLTQQYAKYQAAAGRAVGIGTGVAWQAALESAARCGAQQVYLIDRPTSVTSRRLAEGIWKASSPFVLGAVPAAIAGAVITTSAGDISTAIGPAPVIFAVVLPLIAAFWPILAPLLEIQKFSQMSAAEIEETARIKEPLQAGNETDTSSNSEIVALWGEDALIKWPGAMDSIIYERDEYMVKALLALALAGGASNEETGASKNASKGLTPAYVRSESTGNGRNTVHYRYAMPKEEIDPRVCPIGDGAGRFTPVVSRKIVAVVGTAHVRGVLKRWPRVSQPGTDLSLSKFVE